MENKIELLTLNLRNPSYERVIKQIDWIEKRTEDIFILTETKNSKGCNYLEEYFKDRKGIQKYYTCFPKNQNGNLGVMLISKWSINSVDLCFDAESEFYGRIINAEIQHIKNKINIMGIYVPSRDKTEEKIRRKRFFIETLLDYVKTKPIDIVCGDFNILDRFHEPQYKTFFGWEYDFYDQLQELKYLDAYKHFNPLYNEHTWVGRTNNGYKYDYFFVSDKLKEYLDSCKYVHETRNTKLTDHSAVKLNITFKE